jgi:hypothetical protein
MLDSIFALSFHSIKLVLEYDDCDPSSNSPFPRVQPVSPATNRPQFSVCNVEARHLSPSPERLSEPRPCSAYQDLPMILCGGAMRLCAVGQGSAL